MSVTDLAVDRTSVEQNIKQSVIGEMSQPWNGFEGDVLQLLVDAGLFSVQRAVPRHGQHLDSGGAPVVAGLLEVRPDQSQGRVPEVIH